MTLDGQSYSREPPDSEQHHVTHVRAVSDGVPFRKFYDVDSVPSAGDGSSPQVEPAGSSSSFSQWQPEHQRLPTYLLGEGNFSEPAPDRERN